MRRRGLRRTLFGRHGFLAPLSTAVAASCAIPALAAPVRVGRDTYVDGGVHSPTNVDVLRHEGLDLVVVLSPMSAERRSDLDDAPLARRLADLKLRSELRSLRAHGARAVDIVRESFLSTGRQLLSPTNRSRLAPLASRPCRIAG